MSPVGDTSDVRMNRHLEKCCMKQLTRTLFVLAAFYEQASAATYYVDPQSGDNSRAGTAIASAWKNPPGTRNVTDTGFYTPTWGAVSSTNKIQCGDKILLKGGSTQTSAQGGAWRIDGTYYAVNCSKSNPITIRVADGSSPANEWPGSSGHFTIDGDSVTTTSTRYSSASGGPSSGGYGALVDVENINYLKIAGLSAAQRIVIRDIATARSAGTDAGMLLQGSSSGNPDNVLGRWVEWLEIYGKDSVLGDAGACINVGDIGDVYLSQIHCHDWPGSPGIETGLMSGHWVQGLVIKDSEIGPLQGVQYGRCNGGSNNGKPCLIYDQSGAGPWSTPDCPGATVEGSTNATCAFANRDQDALILETPWRDNPIGGASWIINTKVHNNWSGVGNSGGNNSWNQPMLGRLRGLTTWHNSRSNQGWASGKHGLQSSGDGSASRNAPPDPTLIVQYSTFYNAAYSDMLSGPHGSGSTYAYNTTFSTPNSFAIFGYAACGIAQEFYNSIFDTSGTVVPAISSPNSCAYWANGNLFPPAFSANLFYGSSTSSGLSNTDSFCRRSDKSFTGTRCVSNAQCNTGAGETCRAKSASTTHSSPPAFLDPALGTGNILGVDPQFANVSGSCKSSSFDSRDMSSCDFQLRATSPGIDRGTYFMKAAGAGNCSSTPCVISVKAGSPEPWQMSAFLPRNEGGIAYCAYSNGQMHWYCDGSANGQVGASCSGPFDPVCAGVLCTSRICRTASDCVTSGDICTNNAWGTPPKRLFLSDPRSFFIAPNSNWGIGPNNGDTIQIKGAACNNSALELGSTERARIVSMTGTSISLDRVCSWTDSAGIHLPWTGSAPDIGAFEYTGVQTPPSAPGNLRVVP